MGWVGSVIWWDDLLKIDTPDNNVTDEATTL